MSRPPHPRHSRAEFLRRAAAVSVGAIGLGGRLPALAAAAEPGRTTLVARDEAITDGRALAARERVLPPVSAPHFNLLGLHWQGDGEVSFRSRAPDGRWSAWRRAAVHELPDPGSAERGPAEWRLGTAVWTEEADAVQYRLSGEVTKVRAHFVWSPTQPLRSPAVAAPPFILPRAAWGADETIVRAAPYYADRLALAVVHHTAGGSPATPERSAAIVRAIQTYHVKSNGWNDIGYNFLVDPFGQVFEGRVGGIERNVVGAHAAGYNAGSVGVALLGDFQRKTITPEAHGALAAVLSWRLDVAHVDPIAFATYGSRTLRAVSGHRDVGSTACPGENLYPSLDALAAEAASLGLPKLYEPKAEVGGDGSVRFSARLSEPRSWSVAVTDAAGAHVAAQQGSGAFVDWIWEAGAVTGRYGYTIEAGADILPARGSFRLGDPAPPDPGPRPARPANLPRRIPRWAWELRTWHMTPRAQRGPRPTAAPRRPPRWYWDWLAWLEAVERWNEAGGGG
jgi:hypothetical protein